MPGAWYNQPEAQAILDRISPSDINIDTIRTSKGEVFVWVLPDDLEKRLEVIRYSTVDEQVGFRLSEVEHDFDKQERWYEEEETQASVSDRISAKWGNPNVLIGYGLETANRLWKKDPNIIKTTIRKQKDITKVQKELEAAGRL